MYGTLGTKKSILKTILFCTPQSHTELRQSHTELRQSHTELRQSHTELRQSHSELRQSHSELRRSNTELHSSHTELYTHPQGSIFYILTTRKNYSIVCSIFQYAKKLQTFV